MRQINRLEKKSKNLDSINFGEFIEPYTKRWYIYLVSLILAIGAVYLYIRYSIPIYKNSASIIINENNNKSNSATFSVLEDLEFVPSSSNLMNEIEILKSQSVLKPVVDSLNLNTTIYLIGDKSKLRRFELFDDSPISIKTKLKEEQNPISYTKSFELTFYTFNKIELVFPNGKVKVCSYKDSIILDEVGNKIFLTKTPIFNQSWIGRRIEVIISSQQRSIEKLRRELVIEKQNKESSVITLSISGPNQTKNNKILKYLINSYQLDGLNDKNIVKSNTSDFIKERIRFLLEELNEVEIDGENYKEEKGITDYQADLNEFLNSKGASERSLIENSIQLNLIGLLFDFLSKSDDFEDLMPTNLGLQDQSINTLTEQYNKLILDRKKLLQTTKENNPLVIRCETQLTSIKASLDKSLKNVKNSLEFKVKSYEQQFRKYNNELNSMPKFEREYRSIIRQQQIKESLYLYLLQKREENEIELAASVTNIKVIIPPNSEGSMVSPNKFFLYFIALVLAFIIPIGLIYLSEMLDNKLKSAKDLGDLTLLGQIPKSNKANSIIDDTDRTFLSESFRMLRTNINFSLSDIQKCKVIALSSTLPGEGKTFISMNLANSLSKTGLKVVVIGLDLRMPKLNDYVVVSHAVGVSNFIVDESLTPLDIIQPISETNNLFMVNAGDIPPNPAELLLKPRFKALMSYLRENYDYIIMDTSPIGLISDCLPVVKNEADLLLYVARVGYLQKQMLSIPRSFLEDGLVDNLAIVLNYTDPFDKKYGYGYGYGYGYSGYTNGYFSETNKSFFQRLIQIFKKN